MTSGDLVLMGSGFFVCCVGEFRWRTNFGPVMVKERGESIGFTGCSDGVALEVWVFGR